MLSLYKLNNAKTFPKGVKNYIVFVTSAEVSMEYQEGSTEQQSAVSQQESL